MVRDDPYRRTYDAEREQYLRACGYRVLRFANEQVMKHLDEVLKSIAERFG